MKRILKNIFLITIPVSVLLFILLEIIVRISFDYIEYYDNPMNYWSRPSPYSAFTAKPGKYDKKTVNSHGFISTPEISASKPENFIRIVFLGGSSTAGVGINLEDKETWPWKTVELLKAENKNRKIDFINAAIGGYTTFESYGRLWSRLRFFDPDIIVVNHAWNEMYYFNELADNPLMWRTETGWDQSNEAWHSFKSLLLSRSQVIVRIKLIIDQFKKENGETGKNKGISSQFNSKGLDILAGNLSLLKSYSDTFNCKIFFCKQPTLITETTKESDRGRCKYELHGFGHAEHIKAFNEIYGLIENSYDKKNIIDLTSVSGISDNFYDHIHPTRKGTSEIAVIVADSLKNHLVPN